VGRELGGDDRGEHPTGAVEQRGRGVVAGGLDAEDERAIHGARIAPGGGASERGCEIGRRGTLRFC
jgi:hypothetical protein